jgi:hypothetical protein
MELGLSLVNPFPPETREVYFGLAERNWWENNTFQHPSLSFDGLCNLKIHTSDCIPHHKEFQIRLRET